MTIAAPHPGIGQHGLINRTASMASAPTPATHATPATPAGTDGPVAALDSQSARHLVPTGAGHVAWRRFGHGAPLVLLHGGHGSWRHWLRNIEALAPTRTLWVPDLPGYGESAPPAEPTLPSLVAALDDSLAQLIGPETPIDLAGFSFGGLVAAHFAEHRRHVSRLALIGPAGHGGTRRPRGELQSWRDAHRQGDQAALRAIMRHNLLQHMLHDEAAVDETALRVHIDSCLAARFHSRPISRAGGLLPVLDRFTGPTLLLWGEHDVTVTPAELLPHLLSGHPHRQGRILPGAGHWALYEAAGAVNAVLQDFLGRPAA
jgi:pimeloyl-ACP methyl ester carboxylesterase